MTKKDKKKTFSLRVTPNNHKEIMNIGIGSLSRGVETLLQFYNNFHSESKTNEYSELQNFKDESDIIKHEIASLGLEDKYSKELNNTLRDFEDKFKKRKEEFIKSRIDALQEKYNLKNSKEPSSTQKKEKKKPETNKTKTKSKPNAAFMRPVQPDDSLAQVVGSKPIPRTQIVKKMWDYIKKNKLQDPKNRRNILADKKLKAIFDGKKSVTMFELAKIIGKHINQDCSE